jgi:aminocarboxymuconate-semialdehyde decarboxylase
VTAPVVDVHAHHVGDEVVQRIRDDGELHGIRLVGPSEATRVQVGDHTSGLPLIPPLTDVDARLRWMDRAGIDVQLVSPWMDLAGYHLPAAAGHWLSRIQNDALAALAARHPDRFMAAATVPLQDPVSAAEELSRAVRLGHRAVQIGARVQDVGLDDEGLEPFWDMVERLDVAVIVHPAELDVPDRHRRLFLHILVGNPSETTFAAAALMLGGVLERHPGLRVLLVHGGGFVPYQIGRIARGQQAAPPPVRGSCTVSATESANRFFYDGILHDPASLRRLAEFAPDGHVLLGSDYPFPMRLDDPCAAFVEAGLRRETADAAAWLGRVQLNTPDASSAASPR